MFNRKWYLLLLLPAVVFGISFYFQVKYLLTMYRVRNEQFTTLVRTALAETMQDVEKDAVARFTYELIREDERHRNRNHAGTERRR